MNLIIPLPEEGKCLLKAGQKVDFNTPFVEIKKEIEKEILLAEKLNVPAKKIFNYLKKFVGDQVNKDEIIAVKKGVFSDSKYIAEYQGIITEVDHEKGRITIKIQDEKDMIINCYFNGSIQEIKKTSLILEVKQKQEYTLKKCTRTTGGEIVYLNEISNETTTELEDKIIAIEEISDINLSKMDVLGVKGIISPMKAPEKETDLPFFQIKDAPSFKIIREAKFPYCLTEVSSSKIIFYK
jgi:hypothetical protein